MIRWKGNTIEKDFIYTVNKAAYSEIKVKGSLFIGSLFPAESREEAETTLIEIRKKYYDATHNCFAYIITPDDFRYSDDGEPSGTAGRPIWQVLGKFQLERVLCVVTRYFGGTKLGTGGLIRAYSQSAEETIARAEVVKKLLPVTLQLKYNFSLISKIHHLASGFNAQITDDADASGMISKVQILPSRKNDFLEKVIQETAGKVQII
ncbi:MAG: YigZ family protein [Calditrichia bacterium]